MRAQSLLEAVLRRRRPFGVAPPIQEAADGAEGGTTPVDEYWSGHTVNSTPFRSAGASEKYLEWRFAEYPLFREFMGLWGDHAGHVVLDYGCGPGNDVTGFLLYSGAEHVIGIDVSRKALELAQARIELHRVPPERVTLLHNSDGSVGIPLEDESVDYINCGGVLHHTSDPGGILSEFRRVLRPDGEARVMVYNRNSLWFHLYTAYVKMVVEGAFSGLTVEQAFTLNTDGEECPISRAYVPEDFLGQAVAAGLKGEFLGGYLAKYELELYSRYGEKGRTDERLSDEHRAFLNQLHRDHSGLPLFRAKHAGVGGSYRLRRSR